MMIKTMPGFGAVQSLRTATQHGLSYAKKSAAIEMAWGCRWCILDGNPGKFCCGSTDAEVDRCCHS